MIQALWAKFIFLFPFKRMRGCDRKPFSGRDESLKALPFSSNTNLCLWHRNNYKVTGRRSQTMVPAVHSGQKQTTLKRNTTRPKVTKLHNTTAWTHAHSWTVGDRPLTPGKLTSLPDLDFGLNIWWHTPGNTIPGCVLLHVKTNKPCITS